MSVEAELRNQNERLELLLNLTAQITSSLDLREVLRAVAANIREVIHADAVVVSLPDAPSGKFRAFAVDFPQGKGMIKEELLVSPSPRVKKAMETLKPAIIDIRELGESAERYSVAAAEGIRALCTIPLANRGRALGILSILRRTDTPFLPEDVDFLSRASGQIAIAIENALAYREISELKDKLAQEKLYLEEEIRSDFNFENIVGSSPALNHVLELVETVAPSDSTVLLLGETGTGKELIARAIHDRSRRKDRTFVKLNCAAIPTGLLESDLSETAALLCGCERTPTLAQPRGGDQDEKPPRHILLAIALPRPCSLVPGLMNSVDGIGVPPNGHLHTVRSWTAGTGAFCS